MTPVDQTHLYEPDDPAKYGTCLTAAVASVLDLDHDTVPHFAHPDRFTDKTHFALHEVDAVFQGLAPMNWIDALPVWARMMGWKAVWETVPEEVPDGYCVGSGDGPRGARHAVVCEMDGGVPTVVHDPHPSRDGLVGEPDGFWYFLPFD